MKTGDIFYILKNDEVKEYKYLCQQPGIGNENYFIVINQHQEPERFHKDDLSMIFIDKKLAIEALIIDLQTYIGDLETELKNNAGVVEKGDFK